MSLWVPPSSIPAKSDGDTLTAKDLKDVIASLQDLLNGRLGNVNINTALDLSERIAAFKVIFPGDVRFADDYATGSSTGGIQEAIDSCPVYGGRVDCSAKLYSAQACIWLHTGVELRLNGATIQRAAGSITDASPNNSGAVIHVSPKGANGTPAQAGTAQSNISIIGPGIIDGNFSAFTSLTNTNINVQGIRLRFVDGLTVENVTVQNTLQDAYSIESCRNFNLHGIQAHTVGQWSVTASKNALSLYNFPNDTNYAKDGTVSDFVFTNVGDEAIAMQDQNGNISISNGVVDGCDFLIELGGNGTISTGGLGFSNITAKNLLFHAVTFNALNGSTYSDVDFCNIRAAGHPANHETGAVHLNPGSTNNLKRIHFTDFHVLNINTKDTNAQQWIESQPVGTPGHEDITFDNCTFSGKSGSTRTTDLGLNLRSGHNRIRFKNVTWIDVPGKGVLLHDGAVASATMQEVILEDCIVDGCNDIAYRVNQDSTTGTMKNIRLLNCTAKDAAKQGGLYGFQLWVSAAGGTLNHVALRGCRAYKTSGTAMTHGLSLDQTAGTLDEVIVEQPDFSGVQTAELTGSGTVTNVHFTPRPGRGTDIASAATIAIPTDGDVFHVTGTTNITNGITVNAWDKGRRVKLIFDGILTVSATGTSKLAGAMVTTADDSLCLTCDGNSWNEDSRSINA